jgi:head-tail adaptor
MATKNHIGKMDKRITLLEPVDTRLPSGGGETTYVTVLTTWAEVLPVKSSRMLTDSQIELQDSMQFNFRFSLDGREPQKRWVIDYRNHRYIIHSIIEKDEAKRFWRVIAAVNIEQVRHGTTFH